MEEQREPLPSLTAEEYPLLLGLHRDLVEQLERVPDSRSEPIERLRDMVAVLRARLDEYEAGLRDA